MSLRLRALALVLFVAGASSGVTAWLILRQAAREVRMSAAAGREDLARITGGLRDYGLTQGTWTGVGPTVRELAATTGQRVRVHAEDGTLVTDSDVLAGRAPRRVVGEPVVVDARPVLRLRDDPDPTLLGRLTLDGLGRYRAGVAYAACVTASGGTVRGDVGRDGIPEYTAVGGDPGCLARRDPTAAKDDAAAVRECAEPPFSTVRDCLSTVFARRAAGVAPSRLSVYVGAVDDEPAAFATGPAVAAAAGVAVTAVAVALLMSRRVLRPVRALTGAAAAVGGGDLAQRVPVAGGDELAALARSFNRMADSLQASEERQRRLVADVAHELRTPLSNVRGYLEALRDGVLEATPELVESLHEEVLLQQRIVEDLQTLATAESDATTYRRGPVDLGDVADAAVAAHRAAADAAGVALVVERAPAPAEGDPDRLRQVVGNLLSNAVRACREGGSVAVRTGVTDDEATVEVRDTGTGIAPADLPHVFDRLWRADTARGRATGGSGLGLAIARRIAEDHGGTIRATSVLGEGSTFTLVLPPGGSPRT